MTELQLLAHQDQMTAHRVEFQEWFQSTISPAIMPRLPDGKPCDGHTFSLVLDIAWKSWKAARHL